MTNEFILPVERLIEQFAKMPGVGRKSATRYALAVLDLTPDSVREFSDVLLDSLTKIKRCRICGNLSESEICSICADDKREGVICVVEDPRAVMSLERVRDFKGKYHVLGGVLSPMNGVGPDKLRIKELLARIESENISEIIIATNPTVEGEATAMYLMRLIKPLGVKVSRLAYGVPVGGDIEYADEVTLSRAIEGRREI